MKTAATLGMIGAILMTGCTTTPDIGGIATPARIEAVVALGAYFGGKEIIKQGNKELLEQAHAALLGLELAEVVDTLTIVRILEQTDLKGTLNSTEGQLIIAAAMVFVDTYSGQATEIKDMVRVKAVIRGLARGFEYALVDDGRRTPATTASRLEGEAKATR